MSSCNIHQNCIPKKNGNINDNSCFNSYTNYNNKNLNINSKANHHYDQCFVEHQHNQSIRPGLYHMSNFHDSNCEAPNTQELSLEQPAVNYRDGYGWTSMFGCNVTNDSQLRNAKNLTNPKLVQQLNPRNIGSVPYMGRGFGNIGVESVLQPGEDTNQSKSCNTCSGVNINRFVPMINCLEKNVQKADNIIQEVNDESWVRGGQPSRQLIRDKRYLERCGYLDNGKYWVKK